MARLFDYKTQSAEFYGLGRALVQRDPLDVLRIYLSGSADSKFDSRYGIETRMPDLLTSHDRVGNNFSAATLYRGVRAAPFREFLRQISLDRNLGFVDYGCGKGRAMILAAEYGFRRVRGLEFSRQLVENARCNLAFVRDQFETDFHVLHTDVTEYFPTPEDHVFFIYDPFDARVLARCLANIERSYQSDPRPIHVIYHNNLVRDIKSLVDIESWPRCALHNVQGNLFFFLSMSPARSLS